LQVLTTLAHDWRVVELDSRFAVTSDGVYIAYQAAGAGPIDLVWQPDWPGNIDMEWEVPAVSTLLGACLSFARVVLHDHRGVGLSSRNVAIPNLETRVGDLSYVLDAVGSEHPTLVGVGASGSVNALLAGTKPNRIAGLVWIDPAPRYTWADDNPWGRTPEQISTELRHLELWGSSDYGRAFAAFEASIGNPIPEADVDPISKASRNACTPDVARALHDMWIETDVRDVLSAIQVPTLILAHEDLGEVDRAKDVAARIPGSHLVEISGEGFTSPTMEAMAEEIRRFVGAARTTVEVDTLLSTVLFTDIVGSTERAATLGDRRWSDVVERHHARVREALARWHGTEQDTAGDGFFATFEGPARAIRCAHEIIENVRPLGLEIRAGVHTGECRIIDGKVGGIAVVTGARVAHTAGPSEVRVSQTVKDLVAGSGLTFDDAGEHDLKGVPGRWRLYVVPDV
jgi:class 3 adenylate cyclase/pimeloyl-ACP methyl ester carboxylesterase